MPSAGVDEVMQGRNTSIDVLTIAIVIFAVGFVCGLIFMAAIK